MLAHYQAIIHLDVPPRPGVRMMIEPVLRAIRGVKDVTILPREAVVTVRYRGDQAGLADIVRAIEDAGPRVSAVAQRHA